MTSPQTYQQLIDQEALYWNSVQPDPTSPQLWHDEQLFDMFFGREYARLISRAVESGGRVLELGCGEGKLALRLAEQNVRVEGIDISPDRILRAKRAARSSKKSKRASFRVGDLNTISLPRHRYSCVVAHDALHHVLNLQHLLDQVRKTLKPGGRFLLMDYQGMGRVRKLLAAGLVALLPTYESYREKWSRRRQLKGFLASEREKRADMEQGRSGSLHPESPFEGISQTSIVPAVRARFQIDRIVFSSPFWFYLAPKLRMPEALRYRIARAMKWLDDRIATIVPSLGAYVSIEARKR